MASTKIAIVVSHPIQHFCPQYASWALIPGMEIKVFFASTHGLDAYHDTSFDKVIQWRNLRIDFNHEFLPNAKGKKVSSRIDSPDLPAKLADFNPDIVIVYGYIQPLQRRAISWACENKKTLAMIADSELRQQRSWLKETAKTLVLPRLFSKVDFFLTVGDANEDYYRRYGARDEKFIRTFFPIDTVIFDEALANREIERNRVRSRLGIPNDHTVVLMTGKLVPWKRQIDLVHASNLMQDNSFKITIILAGTGPDESMLKDAAINKGVGGVLFAGFIPPDELIGYYLAADIYAHCSEIEPHSLAISEAIYTGLPVLISNRCGSYGPSDDVRHGLNGFVYSCGNVEAIVAYILRFASDCDLRVRMGMESMVIAKANQRLAHGRSLKQLIDALG